MDTPLKIKLVLDKGYTSNEAQIMILNLLKQTPSFTIKDLVKESEYSDGYGYVRKIIGQLKNGGF